MQEAAGLGHGDHRQGVVHGLGGERGAFQRIERDIDLVAFAGPHLLADIEHRRLVAFAFADHHGGIHVDGVEGVAHGIDRHLVGVFLAAAPAQGRRRHGRRLGDTGDLDGENSVEHGNASPRRIK